VQTDEKKATDLKGIGKALKLNRAQVRRPAIKSIVSILRGGRM